MGVNLCASHGFLTHEEFIRLKEAGVTMYHENIETSEKNFHNICTTHTYADKIKEIKLAQKTGLDVCSGGFRNRRRIQLWKTQRKSIFIT